MLRAERPRVEAGVTHTLLHHPRYHSDLETGRGRPPPHLARLCRPGLTLRCRRWRGYRLGTLDAEGVFTSAWGATLVFLYVTRNDWPFSLLGVCLACFYWGIFVGAHLVL